jgi:hypothetical protein
MEKTITDPVLEFKPLFYILDKCQHTVLAAKKQDRYEVSGMYVRFDKDKNDWKIWPANFNNQAPWEFPDRYEITKNEEEAWYFAVLFSGKPLNDGQCLERYPRSEDFPKS